MVLAYNQQPVRSKRKKKVTARGSRLRPREDRGASFRTTSRLVGRRMSRRRWKRSRKKSVRRRDVDDMHRPSVIEGSQEGVLQAVPLEFRGISSEELQAAVQDAYHSGYYDGCFEGGEAIVTRLLPRDRILPGATAADLIELGIQQLPPEALFPLLSSVEVALSLHQAMNTGQRCSVVRLGDGELLTLAHDTIISTAEATRRGPFLLYAGVELPAPDIRNALADALRKADIVGVPESRHPSFQALLFPVLSYYGLTPAGLRLTSSTVNYRLVEEGHLLPLLQGRKVLLIGNKAEGLAGILAASGICISGIVSPVIGARAAEQVVQMASGYAFDIALVSAGIAAVLICSELSARLGKVALDFGHMANKLESGEMVLR